MLLGKLVLVEQLPMFKGDSLVLKQNVLGGDEVKPSLFATRCDILLESVKAPAPCAIRIVEKMTCWVPNMLALTVQ